MKDVSGLAAPCESCGTVFTHVRSTVGRSKMSLRMPDRRTTCYEPLTKDSPSIRVRILASMARLQKYEWLPGESEDVEIPRYSVKKPLIREYLSRRSCIWKVMSDSQEKPPNVDNVLDPDKVVSTEVYESLMLISEPTPQHHHMTSPTPTSPDGLPPLPAQGRVA